MRNVMISRRIFFTKLTNYFSRFLKNLEKVDVMTEPNKKLTLIFVFSENNKKKLEKNN